MNKILVNGLFLNGNFSGVHYYGENLLSGLTTGVDVIVGKEYKGQMQLNRNIRIVPSSVVAQNRFKRVLFENVTLPFFLRKGGYKLFHSLNYVLPWAPGIPSLLTVHDLISYEYPEFCQDETYRYHKLFQLRSLKNAHQIIAVSHAVKSQIVSCFPSVSGDKVHVIHLGVNKLFFSALSTEVKAKVKSKYNLPEKFILFVGNIEPKKNVAGLIRAFNELKANAELPHELVIVGRKAWKYQDVEEQFEMSSYKEQIHFLGYVELQDMPAIFQLGNVFVFPSFYEGFGLPVLEAMASGIPVVTSACGALSEIGAKSVVYVDPFNIKALASAINHVINDQTLRTTLIESGKDWAKKFLWSTTAQKTQQLYERMLLTFSEK